MSAEHVIGLIGAAAIAVGIVAVVVILRSGSIVPPMPVYPTCVTCGHAQPAHGSGRTSRCHHEYGHSSWNNDSYGNSQRRHGAICPCPEFRPGDAPM